MSDRTTFDGPEMMSRKWRSILLLAGLYGIALGMKFVLIVLKVDAAAIASFDDSVGKAMYALGAAVSAFNLAVGIEDYGKKRGPTVTTQQTTAPIVNAPNANVVETPKS